MGVTNKAALLEFIHEEIDASTSSANHSCQCSLREFGKHFGIIMILLVCEPKKNTGKSFLAFVTKAVNQILFGLKVSNEHIGDEDIGKRMSRLSRTDFFRQRF